MALGEADLGAEGGCEGVDLGQEIGEGECIPSGGVDDGGEGRERGWEQGDGVGGEGERPIAGRARYGRTEAVESPGDGVETTPGIDRRRRCRRCRYDRLFLHRKWKASGVAGATKVYMRAYKKRPKKKKASLRMISPISLKYRDIICDI